MCGACAVLHTPSRPCFEGRGKEGEGGEVRWFGEEKRPNQKRRDDGMAEDCQVDWTGLDRTGQDRTRGRETRTSKVEEIETDRHNTETKIRQIR